MLSNAHAKVIYVHAYTIASALGFDPAETLRRLSTPVETHPSEFRMNLHEGPELAEADRLIDEALAAGKLAPVEKSNVLRLMTALVAPLVTRIREAGFNLEDVGIVTGTATSGLAEAIENTRKDPTNDAGFLPMELGITASALAGIFGFAGPAYVISTACTASAKAIADAARLLLCGRTEAVIAGGVDLVNDLTQMGFEALGTVSSSYPKPFMKGRDGLKLGDGGGFLLLTTKPDLNGVTAIAKLAGFGETSDAHHISAPHPEGDGAKRAMEEAIKSADLKPTDIDFILLHGTSTIQNDSMEAKAVHALFGSSTPCASLKDRVGHQLAGCGAFSAAVALAMLEGSQKGSVAWPIHASACESEDILDEALRDTPVALTGRSGVPREGRVRYVLLNAFAFGGNNASLVFSATTRSKIVVENKRHSMPKLPADAAIFLPQRPPMRLIDEALEADENGAVSRTTIRKGNLLLTEDGRFPAMGLIEIMAQTIGIYAGRLRLLAEEPPAVGLLLGTRKMTLPIPFFDVGAVIRCRIKKTFESDDDLWQFGCECELVPEEQNADPIPAGSATLTVFNPPEGYFEKDAEP